MKRLLLSIFLGFLIFGLTLIPGYVYGNKSYSDMSNCDQIGRVYKDQTVKPPCGSFPKESPWWSNGLPLPIYGFGDCPSGCITYFNWLTLAIDLLFWFVVSYVVYFIFSKNMSLFKR